MPKRILLADDSITIQKVVELTFSDGDYEVTAVNNGAKAIQKLSEMRPDIVLSDIIMPEKNGYEVCEYVKSHPELRHLPVILLTGTFEPFDPDRAEKAGCDAVVTKPFESQSLVHRVEELIAGSQQAASAPTPSPAEPSPWMDDVAPAPADDWSTGPAQEIPPPDAFTHDNDIFNTPQEPPPYMAVEPADEESPFAPPDAGETRAFPRMTFDQLQQMAESSPSGEAENLPWDTAPTVPDIPPIPEPTFEPPPLQDSEPQESPFGAPPPPEDFSGETRAFPMMSLQELRQMSSPESATPSTEPSESSPEPSPWNDETPAFGGETRAFPKMSFDDFTSPTPTTPEPPAAPWLEQQEPSTPAFGGAPEFEQSSSAQESEPEPLPWDTAPPSWPTAAAAEGEGNAFAAETTTSAEPVAEDLPFASEPSREPEEPAWSGAEAASATAEEAEPAIPQTVIAPEPAAAPAAFSADLTDAQIDRIARRVVELMSEQVVRNIAWEVIPDMAEMVVKERIRQLESEA